MNEMEIYEFAAMIEESSVLSKVVEYHSKGQLFEPTLIGASLTDILEDGVSMVYSFFDPEIRKNSIGKYIILDHIEYAKQLNLPYVYLGYWVPKSNKMGYKNEFSGIEVFNNGIWHELKPDSNLQLKPNKSDTVSNQVANLKLPTNFLEI